MGAASDILHRTLFAHTAIRMYVEHFFVAYNFFTHFGKSKNKQTARKKTIKNIKLIYIVTLPPHVWMTQARIAEVKIPKNKINNLGLTESDFSSWMSVRKKTQRQINTRIHIYVQQRCEVKRWWKRRQIIHFNGLLIRIQSRVWFVWHRIFLFAFLSSFLSF